MTKSIQPMTLLAKVMTNKQRVMTKITNLRTNVRTSV